MRCFALIDRWYQYYRFGSFFDTYVSVFAQQSREMNPSLPANYPFEIPFHVGFFGALFAPEKSIFLFDPLLILIVLVVDGRLEQIRSPRLRPTSSAQSSSYSSTSVSMRATRCGVAIRPGAIATCRARRRWWRSSRCRCYCGIDLSWVRLLASWIGSDRGRRCGPGSLSDVLALAGALSDDDARTPDVRCLAAVQEHRRFRAGQKGGWGSRTMTC